LLEFRLGLKKDNTRPGAVDLVPLDLLEVLPDLLPDSHVAHLDLWGISRYITGGLVGVMPHLQVKGVPGTSHHLLLEVVHLDDLTVAGITGAQLREGKVHNRLLICVKVLNLNRSTLQLLRCSLA